MSGWSGSLPFHIPQQVQQTEARLICDYCQQPIEMNDHAFHFILGTVQLNQRNLSPMVLPQNANGSEEWDVHHGCLAAMLVEEAPFVIDEANEIRDRMYPEDVPPHITACAACGTDVEFCYACGAKLDEDDNG